MAGEGGRGIGKESKMRAWEKLHGREGETEEKQNRPRKR